MLAKTIKGLNRCADSDTERHGLARVQQYLVVTDQSRIAAECLTLVAR